MDFKSIQGISYSSLSSEYINKLLTIIHLNKNYMKELVKDGKIYHYGMTPDEAQKLLESKFSKKVKSMDNNYLLMTFFNQVAECAEDWKVQIVIREILSRMK